MSIKTRFAPSPSGLMHLGNARTALLSALAGSRMLLRIEDTDQARSRTEFVTELLADLRWLGIEWDEGPQSADTDPDYFQSRRGSVYRVLYERLFEQGKVYPCFCTPQELEISRKVQLASGRPPRYSGRCASLAPDEAATRLASGEPATLRFRVAKGDVIEFDDVVRGLHRFNSDDIGDFVIQRADGSPAFFFCNAVDDALMGVDLVLRGEDHLSNTPRQLMVLSALDLPCPRYAHISLIVGDDGAPLSKRNGSRSIGQLRSEGYFPSAVVNMLARLGHHYEQESLMTLAELAEGFELQRLGKSPARFDPAHLNHWQHMAVRHGDDDTLWAWLFAESRSLVPEGQRGHFIELVRSNCLFPHEADHWAKVLFADEIGRSDEARAIAESAGEGFFLAAVDAACAHPTDFGAFLGSLRERSGRAGKQLFQPIRAALTGRLDGPELGRIYELIETVRLHRRLAEFTYESE